MSEEQRYDTERLIAIREGHQAAAGDRYFTHRVDMDSASSRRFFDAGFTRGYEAGMAEAKEDRKAAPRIPDPTTPTANAMNAALETARHVLGRWDRLSDSDRRTDFTELFTRFEELCRHRGMELSERDATRKTIRTIRKRLARLSEHFEASDDPDDRLLAVDLDSIAKGEEGTDQGHPMTIMGHIRRERFRQIEKGYDAEHDDEHVNDELSALAVFYAMPEGMRDWPAQETGYGATWAKACLPADWGPFKSTGDRIGDLIIAGALIIADAERLMRSKESEHRDGDGTHPKHMGPWT